jgi:hypothetical protein
MAKANIVEEETTTCTRQDRRGTEDGTTLQIHGANWGICLFQPIRGRRAKIQWTKKIRHWKGQTASDEAILSDDLERQHNARRGKGLWTGNAVEVTGSAIHALWPQEQGFSALVAYKLSVPKRGSRRRDAKLFCMRAPALHSAVKKSSLIGHG